MKLILNEEEMMILVRRSFPPELIPNGYRVESLEAKGYPVKNYEIILERKEETS